MLFQILERCTNKKLKKQQFDCQGASLDKKTSNLLLEKINSGVTYNISIASNDLKPSLQLDYDKFFQNQNLAWKSIYMLPHITQKTQDIEFFKNKMIFKFGKSHPYFCSFCWILEIVPLHLFNHYKTTKNLWEQLKEHMPKR